MHKIIKVEDNLQSTYKITSNSNFSIIDLANQNITSNLIFNVYESELVINVAILNYATHTKKINIDVNIKSSNCKIKILCNCLNLNSSKSYINVNGIMLEDYLNNNIDIKIDGINAGMKSLIKGNPNYFINSNNLIATHGLKIGYVDPQEKFYIMSKGIEENEAIIMLVFSKFNICLNKLDEKTLEAYKLTIMNRWNNNEL